MSVLSDVTKKCKSAMRAGIPILFIKTNSYDLIRDIVDSEELVLLVKKINANNTAEGGKYRPYGEWKRQHPNESPKPDNWLEELDSVNTWSYPHIVTLAGKKGFDEAKLDDYIRGYISRSTDKNVRHNTAILQSSAMIIYSDNICLSDRILQYTEVIEVKYPDHNEIRELVQEKAAQFGERIEGKELERLSSELQGFTKQEAITAMNKVLTREIEETDEDGEIKWLNDEKAVKKIIQDQKAQKLHNGDQILKLITIDEDEEIGGMQELTEYIKNIREKRLLEDEDLNRRTYAVQAPKGILLCGIPGCGKSLAAKLTSKTFGLPLLQMDMGNLMGGHLGESEERMRWALSTVEAMAPCILWVDELEKGFSGAQASGNSDGGTFKRMFGSLLNWMQENKKPCFIFATANDIGGLPKEFFRSGRFDELFAVYLPTASECADIFLACINKAVNKTKEEREKMGKPPLIEEAAQKKDFYLKIVNTYLVNNERVKIVIGSDIQKIVNLALTEQCDDYEANTITQSLWKDALIQEIERCNVYGDSPENIDSIAVGYCRMLRKAFRPTSGKDILFRAKDYHIERAAQIRDNSDEDTAAIKILDRDKESQRCPYDQAVYEKLYPKINQWAADVEMIEKRRLLEG
ncbi:hypothetical protein C0033_13215 [Clostridium sp. chh4-2]|uniref:AAA family ATPase n=1 Tax=Clostridium sp. chh4-2 TaxID=2067550 RepID=UPI000CCE28F8|nr:ATP-binding protein [Clostridium sp. chh4-2]PNV61537.1 hypothetical protein C0033_13215 [Clostridium sp. chh4-2]